MRTRNDFFEPIKNIKLTFSRIKLKKENVKLTKREIESDENQLTVKIDRKVCKSTYSFSRKDIKHII